MAEQCELNMKKINPKPYWYKEFNKIYDELKDLKERQAPVIDPKEIIINKYKEKFDEIDKKFNKRRNNMEFINFILKYKPYNGYEDDLKNNSINFTKESEELLSYLSKKYHPDEYPITPGNEESLLNYFLIEHIEEFINRLLNNIN